MEGNTDKTKNKSRKRKRRGGEKHGGGGANLNYWKRDHPTGSRRTSQSTKRVGNINAYDRKRRGNSEREEGGRRDERGGGVSRSY